MCCVAVFALPHEPPASGCQLQTATPAAIKAASQRVSSREIRMFLFLEWRVRVPPPRDQIHGGPRWRSLPPGIRFHFISSDFESACGA